MDYNERDRIEKTAYEFWASFTDEVIYHNRFHPNHSLLPFLQQYLDTHTACLDAGTILYRARVIDYDKPDAEKTGIVKFMHNERWGMFEGYDEKNSYVPPAYPISIRVDEGIRNEMNLNAVYCLEDENELIDVVRGIFGSQKLRYIINSMLKMK